MHAPLNVALRWTARISGAAIMAVVVLFFLGEGGFAAARPTPQEGVLLALFTASCLGLVAAWRWELAGGALNVGGMALFYLVHYLVSGGFPGGWAFAVIAMPGVLFLACRWRTRPKMRRQAA